MLKLKLFLHARLGKVDPASARSGGSANVCIDQLKNGPTQQGHAEEWSEFLPGVHVETSLASVRAYQIQGWVVRNRAVP